MACVNIESVAYPSWWGGASVVQVTSMSTVGSTDVVFTGSPENVEFLPQGISYLTDGTGGAPATELLPWDRISRVRKLG